MKLWRRAGALAVVMTLGAAASALAESPVTDFDAFIDKTGQTMLARFPEEATDLGLSPLLGLGDDRLNDLSRDYQLETARLARNALEQLRTVDDETLTPDQRVTHAVTEWYLGDIVTMADYLDHEYAVNYITGAHANFPEFMADVHPLTSDAEADAYVERLRVSATQLRQVAENLARSEQQGNLPTETGIGIATWQINNQLGAAVAHPLVTDLEARLRALDLADSEREQIVGAARDAVDAVIVPAYRELLGVVRSVATRSDSRPGVLNHPDGPAYYEALLRHHTTTSLTPAQVHGLGTEEVERVRLELTAALEADGFDVGTLGFAKAIEVAGASSPSVPLRSDADRDALLEATEESSPRPRAPSATCS